MTTPCGNNCSGRARPAPGGRRPALGAGALLLYCVATGAAAAPPAIGGIVDAEHRFAAAVAAQGIGPGFSAFLADSAVVLTPEPRPARAIYDGMPDDGTRRVWRPDIAALSGHYFTVWRHTAGDGWKVLFDGGVAYPVPVERRARLDDAAARGRRTHGAGSAGEPPCEQRFFADWQRKGRAHALGEFAARDVRLLASSFAPLDGRASLALDALRDAPLIAARVARRIASDGNDIYVAYGDYEIGARGQYGKSHYSFVTAFDATDDCRLALELVTPLGSGAPSTP